MTVEFDREYPLREGGTARYYKAGDWGFEYILNEDGTVDPESDANIEYAERAVAAWTEWRDWLKDNLPEPEPKPGEVWLLSQPPGSYQNVPAVVDASGNFTFASRYDMGLDSISIRKAIDSGWTVKRIWPEESA